MHSGDSGKQDVVHLDLKFEVVDPVFARLSLLVNVALFPSAGAR